jgi:protein-disulfide isomerase
MHPLNHKLAGTVFAALALASLPACGQTPKNSAPPKPAAAAQPASPSINKAAIEAYVRHLFAEWPADAKIEVADPRPSEIPGLREVIVTGSLRGQSAQQKLLMTPDGQKFILGTVYDLKQNPFRADIAKLTTDSLPSLGTPGAPVMIVLFTDCQCPYCREEAKTLRANLIQAYPKEVRLYLKDYPLVSMHPWAKAAAIAGRCVFQQSPQVFWQYHDWVFDQQPQITPENLNGKVMTFAQGKEIDGLQFKRCIDTRATEAEVDKSVKEAQSLQVDSTPTLFINGRRISTNLAWPQLKALIDNEIAYQRTAKDAGDKPCCEVKPLLPTVKK